MARPNSYGSKSNRERRRETARKNAKREQVKHVDKCLTKHAIDRPCPV